MNDAGALNAGRNLTQESAGFPETRFRADLAAKVIQLIARQRCVLLVGPNGVGKTRVVHEVAAQLRKSGRAQLFEFAVSDLLTGTRYLGEWETRVGQIVEAAMASGAVLYFSDIWNLPTAAKASNRDGTAWDLIRPLVDQGRLLLIGEMSQEQLLKLERAPGFTRLFETVSVPALTDEQLLDIAAREAARLHLDASGGTLARSLALCRQFLPAAEGPGPLLELLARVRDYESQKRENDEPEAITPEFVEKVFSIYSGLPPIVVSPSVTKPVAEIVAWFEGQIVGQKEAIRSVVEAIALYKSGLHDPSRPIGSFLFVGPTGVGKTELARALARYLFGSEDRLLAFDLSEYKDYHAYQSLIGDPANPQQPARLVDPVRARPFQVILFDEIEKAHPNVWDLLLQLLDEGRLTPGTGKPLSFRNTIVIATSNVGAKEQARESPGFVTGTQDAAGERMSRALEEAFRPELLNRFAHVCFFHALGPEHVRQIAQMELRRVLARQGIAGRNIAIDVTPSVLDLVVEHGYDAKYGARALRRMIQRYVSVPVATLLLERAVEDGSILRLAATQGSVRVQVVDTDETRKRREESRPIKTRLGQLSSSNEIAALLDDFESQQARLVSDVRRSETAHAGGDESGAGHSWQNVEALARVARRREVALSAQRRLDRLRGDASDLSAWLERAVTREEREKLVAALLRYESELRAARRELVLMPEPAVSDALIVIRELAPANENAIALFRTYSGWARRRGYSVDLVCEPLAPHEPIVAAIGGHYAWGYLHLETGHHRFRGSRRNAVVHVRVMGWQDSSQETKFSSQRALKKNGLLGGRVRSRLQVEGLDLVIQNERTLVENRSFAGGIVPSFVAASAEPDNEVRRYDAEPFLLKDYLTGTSGRADVLAPDNFHDLLSRRVEAKYSAADPSSIVT